MRHFTRFFEKSKIIKNTNRRKTIRWHIRRVPSKHVKQIDKPSCVGDAELLTRRETIWKTQLDLFHWSS